jgi:hypothetical protein
MRQGKGLLAAAGANAEEDYVTDGLVLYYDAGKTASYPGTGTTWTDLVSNTTATLQNGASFSSNNGGEIVFDGSNDYVQVSTNTSFFNVSAATFIVWLRLDDLSQLSYTGLFFARGSTVEGLNLFGSTERVGYHWNSAASTYDFNSGLAIPAQEMCMVAASVQTNFADLYLCRSSGTTSARNTTNHPSVTISNIEIGRDSSFFGSRYLDGSIPIAQLYNRALSSTEINQNFEAFKGRFGL